MKSSFVGFKISKKIIKKILWVLVKIAGFPFQFPFFYWLVNQHPTSHSMINILRYAYFMTSV